MLMLALLGPDAALALAPAIAEDAPPPPYRPITPSWEGTVVVLTGRDLTVEQVVQVARFGAKVVLSPEARQRSADAHGLLLEAAAEGIAVYWFNRAPGSGRQQQIFTGDPLSPENRALLEARQLSIFRRGALAGLGPEISDEEIVRAMMVVRANTMSFEAASPQLTQRLLDLLNDRISPVVQSRSTVGEGDLGPFTNIGANMDVAVSQRQLRFSNTFFTVMAPAEAAPGEPGRFGNTMGNELISAALMQEIEGLINPVPPEGSALVKSVEDLQTQTRLKVSRARQAVADTFDLLAEDLLTGTTWLDWRKQQDAARSFGGPPTAVWTALRRALPIEDDAAPRQRPLHEVAVSFMHDNPVASFFSDNDREPAAARQRTTP